MARALRSYCKTLVPRTHGQQKRRNPHRGHGKIPDVGALSGRRLRRVHRWFNACMPSRGDETFRERFIRPPTHQGGSLSITFYFIGPLSWGPFSLYFCVTEARERAIPSSCFFNERRKG